ncbi:MAG TPA: hypothetical protein VFQ77_07790 [Pseudonocardiaceae bacterium]|jgi:hypothetical protein|nr:hypothetical protein [Pseudonocardiaceae bacterium]
MIETGGQVSLAPEVEQLLLDVVADGFTMYCCGPKAGPTALLAAYEWPHCVDLVTVRDFDRIIAARAPNRGELDVFAPEVVVWAYEGPPQATLRALLDLVHPLHPDAPHGEYPAPRNLHIPRAEQRPTTIRLPSPGHAGARARRLATAMAVGPRNELPTWP